MSIPNNRDEVIVAKISASGGIYSGPSTSTAPKNATEPVPAGFNNLGFIGPDGVAKTEDRTTRNIMAASGVKVKSVTTGKDVSYSLTFLQTNKAVLVEVFGEANVTETDTGLLLVDSAADMPVRSFIFDLNAGADYIREYVPAGQVTTVGDTVLGGEEELSYTVTIEASDDTRGNKSYRWIDQGAGLASA